MRLVFLILLLHLLFTTVFYNIANAQADLDSLLIEVLEFPDSAAIGTEQLVSGIVTNMGNDTVFYDFNLKVGFDSIPPQQDFNYEFDEVIPCTDCYLFPGESKSFSKPVLLNNQRVSPNSENVIIVWPSEAISGQNSSQFRAKSFFVEGSLIGNQVNTGCDNILIEKFEDVTEISGLDDSNDVTITVFNDNDDIIYYCANNCPENRVSIDLPYEGFYYVQVEKSNQSGICNLSKTIFVDSDDFPQNPDTSFVDYPDTSFVDYPDTSFVDYPDTSFVDYPDTSFVDYPDTSFVDYPDTSFVYYPDTSFVDYPDTSFVDYPDTSFVDYPDTSFVDYPDTSFVDYPDTSFVDYPDTSFVEYPDTSFVDYPDTSFVDYPDTSFVDYPDTSFVEYPDTSFIETQDTLSNTENIGFGYRCGIKVSLEENKFHFDLPTEGKSTITIKNERGNVIFECKENSCAPNQIIVDLPILEESKCIVFVSYTHNGKVCNNSMVVQGSEVVENWNNSNDVCAEPGFLKVPFISNITTQSASVTIPGYFTNGLLQLKKKGASKWEDIPNSTGAYLLSDLEKCTTYEVRAKYICNEKELFSAKLAFTTLGCVDCNITDLQININKASDNAAVLTWDVYPGMNYILHYKKQEEVQWRKYRTYIPFVMLFNLDKCSTYQFYLEVVCGGEITSSPSDVTNLKTGLCKQLSFDNVDIKVYPQIAHDFVNIDLENIEEINTIGLYNQEGKLLQSVDKSNVSNENYRLNISALSKGLYIISASTIDNVYSKKFMKQ